MNTPFVLIRLSLLSLWSRRDTAILIVLALAMGVALLLGVEKLRQGARNGFANTISGTDLVVGARSGSLNLLLYAVFRVGNATSNVSWSAYRRIAEHPDVAWTIPLSLGDNHRGYRVVGTSEDYFAHLRYGRGRHLEFTAGKAFSDVFDVVLGAEVAAALAYRVGDEIVVSHGLGEINTNTHDDRPFRVSGILARTGTPVDRSLHVSLAGIEAMHIDWREGTRQPGLRFSPERLRKMKLQPRAVTAFLVGLKSRFAVFTLQREINNDRREPLLAILPGVALQQLWSLMRNVEWALTAIATLVALSALLGMLAMLLAGLGERRREIAIFRSVGARPWQVIFLVTSEAVGLVIVAMVLGLAVLFGALVLAENWMAETYGVRAAGTGLGTLELAYLAGILLVGLLAGLLPSVAAYRRSVANGLTIRL